MRIIAFVTDPVPVRSILIYLDLASRPPLQDPPLASCGVEPFTPEEKESKSKGDVDDLEARHLCRV